MHDRGSSRLRATDGPEPFKSAIFGPSSPGDFEPLAKPATSGTQTPSGVLESRAGISIGAGAELPVLATLSVYVASCISKMQSFVMHTFKRLVIQKAARLELL